MGVGNRGKRKKNFKKAEPLHGWRRRAGWTEKCGLTQTFKFPISGADSWVVELFRHCTSQLFAWPGGEVWINWKTEFWNAYWRETIAFFTTVCPSARLKSMGSRTLFLPAWWLWCRVQCLTHTKPSGNDCGEIELETGCLHERQLVAEWMFRLNAKLGSRMLAVR